MTRPNIEGLIARLQATNQFRPNADICTEDVIAALQSQAERIKELEAEIITRTSYGDEQTDFAIKLAAERDALRAQLAEIEKREPVAWAISYDGVTPYTLWCEGDGALLDCEVKRQGGTTRKMPLFTRPMPAQPIIGLQAIHDAITVDPTLAEIEKAEPVASHYFDIEGSLYTAHRAKFLKPSLNGLTPLFTRPMPAQDVTELVEALEKLARLGNGDQYGNSDGNMIARTALSSYKGAK